VDELKFQLNDEVVIAASGEEGVVIGRAEYSYAEPSFLVRYKAGDGRAVEAWWTETALHARLGEKAPVAAS
jgi:hypothetical protein